MGWGCRTRQLIQKGEFVIEMTGEIVVNGNDGIKMASIGKDIYVLSMRKYGNASKFINHSCNPNLIIVPVFMEHNDHRCPHLALFALRDIKMDEQLTVDYGDDYWITKNQLCLCNR